MQTAVKSTFSSTIFEWRIFFNYVVLQFDLRLSFPINILSRCLHAMEYGAYYFFLLFTMFL